MRTTVTRTLGVALGILAAGALMAAASGITTRQARTAAPSTQTLSSSSNTEGSSIAFARADHLHGFTGVATRADEVSSRDTRSTNHAPQDRSAGGYFDLKLNTTDGLSDGGSYHGVLTFRSYGAGSDFSGGPAHQVGFTENGNLWQRWSTSATTWEAWKKVWHSGNDGAGSFLDADFLDGLSSAAFGGGTYDVATFYPGKPPGSSGLMVRLALTRATRLPAGLTGTIAFSGTNATASTAVTIQKRTAGGTTTNIGTLTWTSASSAATVSFASNVDFAAGDFVQFVGPTIQDATLADLSVTLVATRL